MSDKHDPDNEPFSTHSLLAKTWKAFLRLIPVEIILGIVAAIAIFVHYDAKADAQQQQIGEMKSEARDRDAKIEAVRLESKKDQEDLHGELKDDWKALEHRLDKMSADIEDIKLAQLRICASNKVKCQ